MQILIGALIGPAIGFLLRFVLLGFYTVDQNGRATRIRAAAAGDSGRSEFLFEFSLIQPSAGRILPS
jgi:hypothetical protein